MSTIRFFMLFSLMLIHVANQAQASEIMKELSLQDGSHIKGRIMSATASEVTVMSDFGVLRIALDKLTPASRAEVTTLSKPDHEALLQRIQQLEAQVAQLQQENEALSRQAVSSTSSPARTFSPQSPQSGSESGGSYTISSTGKRHNSGCRYFGSGRPCGPNIGIACKICGG